MNSQTTNSSAGSCTGADADTSPVISCNCYIEGDHTVEAVRLALEQKYSERRSLNVALESLYEAMHQATESFGRFFQDQQNELTKIREALDKQQTSVGRFQEELKNIIEPHLHKTFTWRVQDAATNIESGLVELSPVFYSSHGYKLQARIEWWWPNGGQQYSISIRILAGEHDEQLPWPFPHKVTATVVHPTSTKHDVVWTITPNGDLTYWGRQAATAEGDNWWRVGAFNMKTIHDYIITPDDVVLIKFKI